jgi:hypothetical protein
MSTGKENPMVVLVIVLALAAFGLWTAKSNPMIPQNQNNPTENPTGTNPPNNNEVVPLTYGGALTIYKDYRIQFDAGCKATPSNVTYKNGTDIMLDNRAPVSRRISIGSVYGLEAYGFKIIKLTSSTLPKTFLVDCDTSQNVATILVQR